MGGNQNGGGKAPQMPPVSEDTIKKIIDLEYNRVLNQSDESKNKSKEIDANERLAIRTIDAQHQYLKNKPIEDRKFLITMTCCSIAIMTLILGFVTYWVTSGHKDFAIMLCKGIGLVLTHIAAFFGGKFVSKKKTDSGEIADAEEVE